MTEPDVTKVSTAPPPPGPASPSGSHSSPMTLDPASIEAIAQRVADLLRTAAPSGLVDAATLAGVLGVSRDFVYRHAATLGSERLTDGPKARLFFDVDRARAAMASGSTSKRSTEAESRSASGSTARRRRRRSGTNVELLPIGPRREAT